MLLLLASALFVPPASGDSADVGRPPAAESAPAPDRDDDDGDRARPDGPIVVTGRRLDAARTRIDEALGATVYALDNEAIENRPGGETGSLSAILAQAPGAALS